MNVLPSQLLHPGGRGRKRTRVHVHHTPCARAKARTGGRQLGTALRVRARTPRPLGRPLQEEGEQRALPREGWWAGGRGALEGERDRAPLRVRREPVEGSRQGRL